MDKTDRFELGRTFQIVDERTGRTFIGWHPETLDGAIADALRQFNSARSVSLRVAELVDQYCRGGR